MAKPERLPASRSDAAAPPPSGFITPGVLFTGLPRQMPYELAHVGERPG